MHGTGQYGGESISRSVGSANAVAHITNCGDMGPSGWIHNRLSRFTRQRPGATRCHERHVASVEVCAKCWNDAAGRGRASRRWRIRCAPRVYIEGAIFFDDPAIVGDDSFLICAVQNRHAKTGRCRKDEGHRRTRGAHRPLRVLRLVGKCVGTGCGDRRVKRASLVHRKCQAPRCHCAPRCNRKRIARRVPVNRQDTRGLDAQECGVRRVRDVAHGDAAARLKRCRTKCYRSGDVRGAHPRRNSTVGAVGKGCRRAQVGKRPVRVQSQSGYGPHNLNTENISIVGDQTLAWIRHSQRLARKHGVVGIRAGNCTCKRRGGWESTPVDTNVGHHPGVARDSIGRQAQFTVVYWEGRRTCCRGYVHHYVISLTRGQEHFALHAGNTWQRISILGH